MKSKDTELVCILISIIIMVIGMFFYYNISNYIMTISLIIEACILAILFKKKYNTFINSCSIFSAIWFGTIGLATLQLHQLQEKWKIVTFIYLELAYIAFVVGHMLYFKKSDINDKKIAITKKGYLKFITVLFGMVFSAFLAEILIRGYIPIFSGDMSSYQNFSISGIHYFTVSCCLIAPATYIYLHYFKVNKLEIIYLLIINIIALIIPILIVSRQLIIMTVVLLFFIAMYFNKKNETKLIVFALVAVIGVWTLVGNFRNQNEEYLRQALKIQPDAVLSVDNMQIYMYIAFNYDNFNANVGNVNQYSYGLKSTFPVFALTGLKFLIPNLAQDNSLRVIDVYNTYPIIMTPYLDFGWFGIFGYMLIVGAICCNFERISDDNPINILLKMLIKYSLIFTFFSSYFSNATMWFYIIILFIFRRIFFKNKVLKEKVAKGENKNENCASFNVDL